MRLFLRLTSLAASFLLAVWALPGCSSSERKGPAARWKVGAMDKGKMEGAMDKGKMEAPWTRARWMAPWTRARWTACHGQGQDGRHSEVTIARDRPVAGGLGGVRRSRALSVEIFPMPRPAPS